MIRTFEAKLSLVENCHELVQLLLRQLSLREIGGGEMMSRRLSRLVNDFLNRAQHLLRQLFDGFAAVYSFVIDPAHHQRSTNHIRIDLEHVTTPAARAIRRTVTLRSEPC